MNGSGELAEPDLRALRDDGDIFYAERSAVLGGDDCVFDVLDVRDQSHFPDIDLLQAGFDKAAARIRIVVCELLLDLGETEAVGDQLVGIDADLIFAGGPAEARNIDHIGHGFEVFLDNPVFQSTSIPSRHTADWCCAACKNKSGRPGSSRCPFAARPLGAR